MAHGGKLTDRHVAEVADAMASNDVEAISTLFLGLDLDKVKDLRTQYPLLTTFKEQVFCAWKKKYSHVEDQRGVSMRGRSLDDAITQHTCKRNRKNSCLEISRLKVKSPRQAARRSDSAQHVMSGPNLH